MVERFNRTLHNLLRTLSDDEKRAWPDHIATVVYAYNCTPHANTGYSPYYMCFGREPVLPIDIWFKRKSGKVVCLRKIWRKANERQSYSFICDSYMTEGDAVMRCDLRVGEEVHIAHHPIGRNKIQSKYKPDAYRVKQKLSSQTYHVIRRGVTRVLNPANVRQGDNLIDHPTPIVPRRSARVNRGIPPHRYGFN